MEKVVNGGGGGGCDLTLKLTSSDTTSTLVSPTTPPSEPHYPLMEATAAVSYTTGDTIPSGAVRVYKIRWVILSLFVVYSMSNAFQWIQYSIINNIIVRYYGVSSTMVDWLSMIYMVTYIPLIFPASWYLEKKGLRRAVLIGSCGTMLGSWVKVGSVSPDRFWVTFLGQCITAVSQIFILGIPSRLAAVWFGPNQVSTACAIGVFGNQLGVALGFLLPPAIVPDSMDLEVVGKWLSVMFYSIAGLTTALFIAIIFVFREKPPTPPSTAALIQEETGSYFQGVLRLMKNPGYILLLISYGINVGAFYAISTLLNQVVLAHFPGETENAGRIGLLIVLAGMLGSIVCGFILDKTAKFKLVTLSVYISSMVFMLAYTFVFHLDTLWMVFVMAGLLGFFMTGYLPVGFEFAAELTYPEAEGTSSGLLNASAQFFGIFCTMADGQLFSSYGDMAANLLLVAVLFVGCIMTACIREDLRRQAAHKTAVDLDNDGPRV
ncbi:choline/ethanolamine transporter flvcr2a isoform X2 [Procambarus clarkii]|uniref:choline/ethanolamine transporter flvcr2a isoform X2 n=1 Tax=Procambarus clarkii TaxID=6728 RepID=UPI001E671D1F|nr:feline leukemia virus subgroup C receptor-related protein 2-like isoform X1 [Procambarus clarkii]XP_045617582.1 feline leukemia virus subgroup C receptor-related protein 2-like isoform X1 [Procambarus clarkii]